MAKPRVGPDGSQGYRPGTARRTVADLTAAFAGTSVPWERLPSRPGRAPRAASSHPGRRLAAVGGWP
jgi:hypothetical protein